MKKFFYTKDMIIQKKRKLNHCDENNPIQEETVSKLIETIKGDKLLTKWKQALLFWYL